MPSHGGYLRLNYSEFENTSEEGISKVSLGVIQGYGDDLCMILIIQMQRSYS